MRFVFTPIYVRIFLYLLARLPGRARRGPAAELAGRAGGQKSRHPGPPQLMLPRRNALRHVHLHQCVRRLAVQTAGA